MRNAAFEAALRAVIKKGVTTVADIGTGTGLLALMAVKLGAREVFLYEAAEVAGVAAKVLKANGARNCHLFPCHSTEMVDPPKVDVVVSETLGNYALEEHIIETLADARKRFLKPGGVLIPRKLEQFVAPVVSDRLHREFAAWDATGFDLSVAKTMSLNNIYVRTLSAKELLEAKAWDAIDLGTDGRSNRKGEASWKLKAATTIYGFATWWSAELAPGIVLSTAPGCAAHTLGAALFSAAVADRGKGRLKRSASPCARARRRGGNARRLGGDAQRCKGPRSGPPVAQPR